FFFQAEDGIRAATVTGVQTCALPISQPLAVTMNGGAFLGIDVDAERIKRRVKTGYCQVMVNDLDEALRILKNAVRKREPASVGRSEERRVGKEGSCRGAPGTQSRVEE